MVTDTVTDTVEARTESGPVGLARVREGVALAREQATRDVALEDELLHAEVVLDVDLHRLLVRHLARLRGRQQAALVVDRGRQRGPLQADASAPDLARAGGEEHHLVGVAGRRADA